MHCLSVLSMTGLPPISPPPQIVFAVCWVHTDDYESLHAAHEDGMARLHSLVDRLKPTAA